MDILEQKPVLVIISGNRPKHIMHKEIIRFAAYDGRYEDLDSAVSINLLPMISKRWNRLFKWNGEGDMPLNEKLKLKQIVKMVHNVGRWIRFWLRHSAIY